MTAVCLTLLCPTVGITAAESLERVDLDLKHLAAIDRLVAAFAAAGS